jgi:hypothetical protein
MTPESELREELGGVEDDPGADDVSGAAAPEPILGAPFDPRPQREQVRGVLAVIMSALLALMALGPFTVIVADWADWADVEDPLGLTFSPVVGLAGTVLGFYFGSQRNDA